MNKQNRYFVNVSWCVESQGILVTDVSNNQKVFISYPEAAIWDFIVRDIPQVRGIKMFTAIVGKDALGKEALGKEALGKDSRQVEELFLATVHSWLLRGWIKERGNCV